MSPITRRHALKTGAVGIGAVIAAPLLGSFVMPLAARAALPTQLVRRFSAGSGVGQVGILNQPGQIHAGPESLRVLVDGSFLLVDTRNHRLVRWSGSAADQVTQFKPGEVAHVADAMPAGARTWLLDRGADRVTALDATGHIDQTFKVSSALMGKTVRLAAATPTGVMGAVAELGQQSLVEGNRAQAANDSGNDASVNPNVQPAATDTQAITRIEGGLLQADRATVLLNSGEGLLVETSGILTAARWMGSDASGRRYVAVEELIAPFVSRVTVRRYAGARLVGIAELPIDGMHAFPHNPLALSSTGRVFGLVVMATHADVVELTFVDPAVAMTVFQLQANARASQVLAASPDGTGIGSDRILTPDGARVGALTRSSAASTAYSYTATHWYCSYTNYTRCSDGGLKVADRPTYLTAYDTYYDQLPYKWGGTCTIPVPGGFLDFMNNGKMAGDINCTSPILTCAAGLDCSGFVGQTWGITSKYSDMGLVDNFCTQRGAWSQLLQGDAVDNYGSHIQFFNAFSGSSGIYVYESAGVNGWRCYYDYWSYTSLSGYLPYQCNLLS